MTKEDEKEARRKKRTEEMDEIAEELYSLESRLHDLMEEEEKEKLNDQQ